MSIYNSRRDRALDNDPAWERIMLAGSSARLHSPAVEPTQSGARLRKANPVDYLLPVSINWLKSLPREVRPIALAIKYARVVNLLVRQWDDHDACSAYFRTLLADRRGGRRGFPADVQADIRMLQEYYLYAGQTPDERLTIVKLAGAKPERLTGSPRVRIDRSAQAGDTRRNRVGIPILCLVSS